MLRPVATQGLPAAFANLRADYRVIVADPPWRFKSNSLANPGRNALRHYDCMALPEITALPVTDVAAPDSVLFLWVPGPFLAIGAHLPIMRAWALNPVVWASPGSSSIEQLLLCSFGNPTSHWKMGRLEI